MAGEALAVSFAHEALYRVHMFMERATGMFVAHVTPVSAGISGMLIFDAHPSVWVVVRARNPAAAVQKAWDEMELFCKRKTVPVSAEQLVEAIMKGFE